MAGIRGLAEIVIWVQDIDQSLAFYRDRLGLTVISPPHLPATFLRVGVAGTGVPQQIVLVPRPAGSAASGSKADRVLHHIGLEVAPDQYDAVRALGRCRAGGARRCASLPAGRSLLRRRPRWQRGGTRAPHRVKWERGR